MRHLSNLPPPPAPPAGEAGKAQGRGGPIETLHYPAPLAPAGRPVRSYPFKEPSDASALASIPAASHTAAGPFAWGGAGALAEEQTHL